MASVNRFKPTTTYTQVQTGQPIGDEPKEKRAAELADQSIREAYRVDSIDTIREKQLHWGNLGPLTNRRGIEQRGTFGRMVRTKYPNVVLKIGDHEEYSTNARNERTTLEYLTTRKAPHVVRLLDSFSDGRRTGLYMLHAGQSLFDMHLQQEGKRASLAETESYFKQLLEFGCWAAQHQVLHGDHKTANCCVDQYGNVSVIDFSLGSIGPPPFSQYYTRWFRAPEVQLGYHPSEKSEIWAIGCMMWSCYKGSHLFPVFDHETSLSTQQALLHRHCNRLGINTCRLETTLRKDILSRMIERGYAVDAEGATCLLSPFENHWRDFETSLRSMVVENTVSSKKFDLFIDLLRKIFQFDPRDRCTFLEALNHPFFSVEPTDVVMALSVMGSEQQPYRLQVRNPQGMLVQEIQLDNHEPHYHLRKAARHTMLIYHSKIPNLACIFDHVFNKLHNDIFIDMNAVQFTPVYSITRELPPFVGSRQAPMQPRNEPEVKLVLPLPSQPMDEERSLPPYTKNQKPVNPKATKVIRKKKQAVGRNTQVRIEPRKPKSQKKPWRY